MSDRPEGGYLDEVLRKTSVEVSRKFSTPRDVSTMVSTSPRDTRIRGISWASSTDYVGDRRRSSGSSFASGGRSRAPTDPGELASQIKLQLHDVQAKAGVPRVPDMAQESVQERDSVMHTRVATLGGTPKRPLASLKVDAIKEEDVDQTAPTPFTPHILTLQSLKGGLASSDDKEQAHAIEEISKKLEYLMEKYEKEKQSSSEETSWKVKELKQLARVEKEHMQETVDMLKEELSKQSDLAQTYSAEVTRLRGVVDAGSDRGEELDWRLKSLQKKHTAELSAKDAEWTAEIEKLKEELKETQSTKDALRSQLSFRKKSNQIEASLLSHNMKQLEQKLKLEQFEKDKLKEQLEAVSGAQEHLSEEAKKFRQHTDVKTKSLEEELVEMNLEVRRLRSALEGKENDLKDLAEDVQTHTAKSMLLDSVREDVADTVSDIELVNDALVGANSMADKLMSKCGAIRQSQAIIAGQKQRIAELERLLESAARDQSDQIAKCQLLEQQKREMEDLVRHWKGEAGKGERESSELVKQIDDEKNRLEKQLEESCTHSSQLEKHVDVLGGRIEELESQCSAHLHALSNAQRATAETEASLRNQIRGIQAELENVQTESRAVDVRLKEETTHSEALAAELELVKTRCHVAESDLSEMTQLLKDEETKSQDTEERISAEYDGKIHILKGALEQARQESRAKSETVSQLKQDIETMRERCHKAEMDAVDANARADHAEDEKRRAVDTIHEGESATISWQSKEGEYERRIADLEIRLKRESHMVEETKKLMSDVSSDRQSVFGRLCDKEEELSAEARRVKELQQEVELLNMNVEKLETLLVDRDGAIEEYRARLDGRDQIGDVTSLEQQILVARHTISQLENEKDFLQERLSNAKEDVILSSDREKKMRKANEELTEKVNLLTNTAEMRSEMLRRESDTNATLQATVQSLTEELKKAKTTGEGLLSKSVSRIVATLEAERHKYYDIRSNVEELKEFVNDTVESVEKSMSMLAERGILADKRLQEVENAKSLLQEELETLRSNKDQSTTSKRQAVPEEKKPLMEKEQAGRIQNLMIAHKEAKAQQEHLRSTVADLGTMMQSSLAEIGTIFQVMGVASPVTPTLPPVLPIGDPSIMGQSEELEKTKKELEEEKSQRAQLENQLKTNMAEAEEMKSRLVKLQHDISLVEAKHGYVLETESTRYTELESQLMKLLKQTVEIQEENMSLREVNEDLGCQVDELVRAMDEMSDSKAESEESDEVRDDLENELNREKSKRADAEKLVDVLRKNVATLESRVREKVVVTGVDTVYIRRAETAENTLEKIRKEKESLDGVVANLNATLESMQQSTRDHPALDIAQLDAAIDRLKMTRREAEGVLTRLDRKLSIVQQDSSIDHTNTSSHKADIRNAEVSLLQSELNRAWTRIDTLQGQVDATLHSRSPHSSSENDDIAHSEIQTSTLRRAWEQSQDECEELKKKVFNLEKENATLVEGIAVDVAYEKSPQDHSGRLDWEKQRSASLSSKLEDSRRKLEEQHREIHDLKNALNATVESKQAGEADHRANDTIRELTSCVETLQKNIRELKGNEARMQDRIRQLVAELDTRQDCQNLHTSDELHEQMKELQKDLEDLGEIMYNQKSTESTMLASHRRHESIEYLRDVASGLLEEKVGEIESVLHQMSESVHANPNSVTPSKPKCPRCASLEEELALANDLSARQKEALQARYEEMHAEAQVLKDSLEAEHSRELEEQMAGLQKDLESLGEILYHSRAVEKEMTSAGRRSSAERMRVDALALLETKLVDMESILVSMGESTKHCGGAGGDECPKCLTLAKEKDSLAAERNDLVAERDELERELLATCEEVAAANARQTEAMKARYEEMNAEAQVLKDSLEAEHSRELEEQMAGLQKDLESLGEILYHSRAVEKEMTSAGRRSSAERMRVDALALLETKLVDMESILVSMGESTKHCGGAGGDECPKCLTLAKEKDSLAAERNDLVAERNDLVAERDELERELLATCEEVAAANARQTEAMKARYEEMHAEAQVLKDSLEAEHSRELEEQMAGLQKDLESLGEILYHSRAVEKEMTSAGRRSSAERMRVDALALLETKLVDMESILVSMGESTKHCGGAGGDECPKCLTLAKEKDSLAAERNDLVAERDELERELLATCEEVAAANARQTEAMKARYEEMHAEAQVLKDSLEAEHSRELEEQMAGLQKDLESLGEILYHSRAVEKEMTSAGRRSSAERMRASASQLLEGKVAAMESTISVMSSKVRTDQCVQGEVEDAPECIKCAHWRQRVLAAEELAAKMNTQLQAHSDRTDMISARDADADLAAEIHELQKDMNTLSQIMLSRRNSSGSSAATSDKEAEGAENEALDALASKAASIEKFMEVMNETIHNASGELREPKCKNCARLFKRAEEAERSVHDMVAAHEEMAGALETLEVQYSQQVERLQKDLKGAQDNIEALYVENTSLQCQLAEAQDDAESDCTTSDEEESADAGDEGDLKTDEFAPGGYDSRRAEDLLEQQERDKRRLEHIVSDLQNEMERLIDARQHGEGDMDAVRIDPETRKVLKSVLKKHRKTAKCACCTGKCSVKEKKKKDKSVTLNPNISARSPDNIKTPKRPGIFGGGDEKENSEVRKKKPTSSDAKKQSTVNKIGTSKDDSYIDTTMDAAQIMMYEFMTDSDRNAAERNSEKSTVQTVRERLAATREQLGAVTTLPFSERSQEMCESSEDDFVEVPIGPINESTTEADSESDEEFGPWEDMVVGSAQRCEDDNNVDEAEGLAMKAHPDPENTVAENARPATSSAYSTGTKVSKHLADMRAILSELERAGGNKYVIKVVKKTKKSSSRPSSTSDKAPKSKKKTTKKAPKATSARQGRGKADLGPWKSALPPTFKMSSSLKKDLAYLLNSRQEPRKTGRDGHIPVGPNERTAAFALPYNVAGSGTKGVGHYMADGKTVYMAAPDRGCNNRPWPAWTSNNIDSDLHSQKYHNMVKGGSKTTKSRKKNKSRAKSAEPRLGRSRHSAAKKRDPFGPRPYERVWNRHRDILGDSACQATKTHGLSSEAGGSHFTMGDDNKGMYLSKGNTSGKGHPATFRSSELVLLRSDAPPQRPRNAAHDDIKGYRIPQSSYWTHSKKKTLSMAWDK